MMKKRYEIPTIEVLKIKNEDLLTTSGNLNFDQNNLFDHDADDWEWE